MLSAGLQQYNGHFNAGDIRSQPSATAGLDTLAEGSQYALQQLQHEQSLQASENGRKRRNDYDDRATSASGRDTPATPKDARMKSISGHPVRKRISRACDQCNQLRTKCDGRTPCAHCVEFGLMCEYARERKKRGKASRKEIEAMQAAAADAGGPDGIAAEGYDKSPRSVTDDGNGSMASSMKRNRDEENLPHPPQLPPPPRTAVMQQDAIMNTADQPLASAHPHDNMRMQATAITNLPTPRLPSVGMPDRNISIGIGEYSSLDDYNRSMLHPSGVSGHNILHNGPPIVSNSILHGGTITGYGDSMYTVPSPGSQSGMANTFRMGGSPLSGGYLGGSPAAGSPAWLSLPSPTAAMYPHLQQTSNAQPLRYPVLRPLLPHISAIIPITLACDLLDSYFKSISTTYMQPQSPYVLGYVFRKQSILRQSNPRPCSPALLASMLWVAAQTSESPFLTSPPSARGKICQKLLELTVGLLKPLIHTANDGPSHYGNNVINGVALGGFGVALPGHAHEMEGGAPGAVGALDDVATYMHLATVVSASEYKAASLRWWNAAWSLARELKLGRELPLNSEPAVPDGGADGEAQHSHNAAGSMHAQRQGHGAPAGYVSEEEREERRRIWWLLYIVDRHLALCYNRPLFLLDVECDGLYQPENEARWQAGEFYPPEDHAHSLYFRSRGPGFECTGHSIFGYFLPLMTILGEIVDLNKAKNHPRFGSRFRSGSEWNDQVSEITQQLEAYGRSLQAFETANSTNNANSLEGDHRHFTESSPSTHAGGANNPHQRVNESVIQTKTVVAYGTHLMHTLHILLNGRWDPISLLDDDDLWISSPPFMSATAHAVSGAEAIDCILEVDPDISFMPFFFGIYLLQGSFLLLLIADKLRTDATPRVVKACETIVRAHEACVVTLNTEYQRNFRKVMRSALSQVRGIGSEDFGEQQLRRREVLSLYRWSGDGSGLAL